MTGGFATDWKTLLTQFDMHNHKALLYQEDHLKALEPS